MIIVLRRLLMSCRCSSLRELHILLWIGLKEELGVCSNIEIGVRRLILVRLIYSDNPSNLDY